MSDPRALALLERIAVATEGILAAMASAPRSKAKADLSNWRPAVAGFVALWNECCGQLPKAREPEPTTARYRAIVACLKVEADMGLWRGAMRALAASPHHKGDNARGWRADIDFLTQQGQFMRWLDQGRLQPKEGEPVAPKILWCEVCKGAEATYGPGTRNADVRVKPTCAACLEVT